MGCWNGTCGITQLPIFAGDEVVLFFIGQKKADESVAGGFCYSTGIWAPMSLPFYGKYNDYGAVEDIAEGRHTACFLNLLRQNVVEREQGENPYHEQAVVAANLTDLEVVQELIQDGRILGKVSPIWRSGPSHLIGYMMVHRFVFDYMTEAALHRWDGATALADVIEQGREFYRAVLKAAEGENEFGDFPLSMRLRLSIDGDFHGNSFFSLTEASGEGGFHGYGIAFGIRDYMVHLIDMAEARTPLEQAEPMIEAIAKFYVFATNMMNLRKSWGPQGGAGSQGVELKLARGLCERAVEFIDAKRDYWDDAEGDDGDWEGDEAEGETVS